MDPIEDVVPRMLTQRDEERPSAISGVEQWISAGHGTDVTDEVVTLLVVAASAHDHAGRRTLAASLRQHARELLRPPLLHDASGQLFDRP